MFSRNAMMGVKCEYFASDQTKNQNNRYFSSLFKKTTNSNNEG